MAEVNETIVSVEKSGKRGRGVKGNELELIAVEDKTEEDFRRIRLSNVSCCIAVILNHEEHEEHEG